MPKIVEPKRDHPLPNQTIASRTFSLLQPNKILNIYVLVQRRLSTSQLNARLWRLHVNSSRTLYIHCID